MTALDLVAKVSMTCVPGSGYGIIHLLWLSQPFNTFVDATGMYII